MLLRLNLLMKCDNVGADDYHDDGGGLIFDEEHVGDAEDAIDVMRGFS